MNTLSYIIENFSSTFSSNSNGKKIEIFGRSLFIFYLIAFILRFRKQLANEDYYEIRKKIPSDYLDYLLKIVTFINYSLLFCINFGTYQNTQFNVDTIKQIITQIIIAYAIFSLLFVNYFPWFIILPLLLNTAMFYVSNTTTIWTLFVISLFLSHFGLGNKPYSGRKNYDRLRNVIISLAILSLTQLI